MKSIFKGDDDMSYAESTLEEIAKNLKIAVFQIDDSVLHTPSGKEFSPGDRVNVNVACIAINRIAEEIEERHRRNSFIIQRLRREVDAIPNGFYNKDMARDNYVKICNLLQLIEQDVIATRQPETEDE